MRYGFCFLLFSALFVWQAYTYGSWAWILLWPAASCGWAGLAYLAVGPKAFGKRPDGALAWWSVAVLFPLLLYMWTLWHVLVWVSRENAVDLLQPGVYMGRRLRGHEVPSGVTLIVDLTSEFFELATVREGRTYRAYPMLDASACSPVALIEIAQTMCQHQGGILVHCAQGHGRTGLICAVYLLVQGSATCAADALQQVQAKRLGIRLNSAQRLALESTAQLHRTTFDIRN